MTSYPNVRTNTSAPVADRQIEIEFLDPGAGWRISWYIRGWFRGAHVRSQQARSGRAIAL
jgi:hypothetical protein